MSASESTREDPAYRARNEGNPPGSSLYDVSHRDPSHPARQSPPARVAVDLPFDVYTALTGLAAEDETSLNDLIYRAIALYGAYRKFHGEGKLVGAAASEDGLDVVFADF